ncbi:MAG: FG-GAP-like repeat-containing protein, partial [Candidatus Omnitrophica bacterium]|nr:FG-GAP-like repeat-containing protein [Candidatus Omnitrophota bacterium]
MTVPNANPPVAEAYHAPAWMQPQPVSVEGLIMPSTAIRTPPQVLTGSPSAEFAEPELLFQESYITGNEPAKLADANIAPAAPVETDKALPAADALATVIYGGYAVTPSSDTNDEGGDTGGGGTGSPQASPAMVLPENPPGTEAGVFITGLTPSSGVPGTVVVIQGAGFSSTASNNDVKFGSVSSASVTYVSANQLRAAVPQTGVSPGFADVSVTVNSVTSKKTLFSVLKSSAGNVFEDNTQDLLPERLTITDSSIIRLGDIDDDNDLDILVIDTSAGAAYLLLNDGQGTFTDASSANLPAISNLSLVTDAVFGDMNKDGYLDIFLAYSSGQSVRLLLNDGQGKFSDVTGANLPSVSGNTAGIDVGDANGDGMLDIVIANKNVRDVMLSQINDVTGAFSIDANFNLPGVIDGSSDIRFCDINGDGSLDIVTTNNDVVGASSLRNRIYLNNGSGVFTDATESLLPEDSEYSEVLDCGDIDADGDIDIIVANDNQNAVFINNGSGVFEDQTTDRIPTNYFASKDTRLGDMNGDGYLDIVMLGNDKTSLLFNDGQGSFKEDGSIKLPDYKSIPAILGGKNIQVADINGDGSLDIIIGGESLHLLVSTASNKAPVLAPIGNKTVASGKNLTFNVSAEDPNGDELTFLAENLPGGATFLSKIFSWTPAANDIGQPKIVRFIARENTQAALEDSKDITITVTASGLPVIDYHVPDELDLDLTIGQIVQFGIHATDPDGRMLTFKWFLNGVEIPSSSGATSSIIFIVPRIGGNTVEVKVSDSFGIATLQWNLTVGTTQNLPPSIISYSPNQAVVNIDLSAGGGFSFGVTAADPELDILSYTWKFNHVAFPPSDANLSSGAFIDSIKV